MQNSITVSNLFEQQACFNVDASADEVVSQYFYDRPVGYTDGKPADPSQLIHGITFDQRISPENSLGLSVMYGPESVWSADRLGCPIASFSPARVADFRYSSNPQHLSARKATKFGRVRETPVPQSASPPSRYAPYPLGPDSIGRGDLSTSVHQCQWIDGEGPCITDLIGTKIALAQHLQAVHGIRLKADKTTQVCLWRGCYKPMRRESMARHILAVHLKNKVPCPNCEQCFARTDSMQRHWRTCHLVKGEYASEACNDLAFHVES